MIGELSAPEIEDVLMGNVIGRIGAHAFGRTYVVPITYAYDGKAVYGHSREGMKLHMMRENPHVCFEVDHMDDYANWRSVIAAGVFTELRGPEREAGLQLLVDQLERLTEHGPPGESVHPHQGMHAAIIFRIELSEKTGRFERRQ
jgi:uncharacterized protein